MPYHPVSIAQCPIQGIVIVNPVLHRNRPVIVLVITDINRLDSRIDDHALTHGTAIGTGNIFAGRCVGSCQVHAAADHLVTRCADDGVRLRMHTAAKLISLPARNIHLLSDTSADVGAIPASARCAHISGRNDLIILDNDSPVITTQTCPAVGNAFCQVEVVIHLVSSSHMHLLQLQQIDDNSRNHNLYNRKPEYGLGIGPALILAHMIVERQSRIFQNRYL